MNSKTFLRTIAGLVISCTTAIGMGAVAISTASAASVDGYRGTIHIAAQQAESRVFRAYRLVNYLDVDNDGNVTPSYRQGAYDNALIAGANATGANATTADDAFTALTKLDSDYNDTEKSYAPQNELYTFGNTAYGTLEADNVTPDATFDCHKATSTTEAYCEATGLPYGYYLIEEVASSQTESLETGTLALLGSLGASTDGAELDLYAKSVSPSSHKYITDESKRKLPYYNQGEGIGYTLEFAIPAKYIQEFVTKKTDFHFIMQDWLSDGLSYSSTDSIALTEGDKNVTVDAFDPESTKASDVSSGYGMKSSLFDENDTDAAGTYLQWTFKASQTASKATVDASTATVTLPVSFFSTGTDTVVSITYTAYLNGSAVVAGTGNPNYFNVRYSRNPDADVTANPGDNPDDDSYTPVESPRVYTFSVDLYKVDGSTRDSSSALVLGGATFCLASANEYCGDGATGTAIAVTPSPQGSGDYEVSMGADTSDPVYEMQTSGSGHLNIEGVTPGDYYLFEVSAPQGYQRVKEPAHFVVVAGSDFASSNELQYYPISQTDRTLFAPTVPIDTSRSGFLTGDSSAAGDHEVGVCDVNGETTFCFYNYKRNSVDGVLAVTGVAGFIGILATFALAIGGVVILIVGLRKRRG